MSGLEVLNEQCATCIFRPGNKMHLTKGRVASMVRECTRTQSFIPCHETMVYGEDEDDDWGGEATATGPMCRGFFDNHGHVSQMVRIAERLNMIAFVAPPRRQTRKRARFCISGEQTRMSRTFTHAIRIYEEARWPHQWIGMCSCGKGIRCNSNADAKAFFADAGCINASEELLIGRAESAPGGDTA